MSDNWFEVDRKGLRDLLEHRGKQFLVYEMVSNAWDESGVTTVRVGLESIPGARNCVELTVEDDAPEGFHSIGDAYTLFAPSYKKGNAEQRGRFNLGEKLVLACCEKAEIISTQSAVRFDSTGRHSMRERRERGTLIRAAIRMTGVELERVLEAAKLLIPPSDQRTFINGEELAAPSLVSEIGGVTLPTELDSGDGAIRKTERKTFVHIYAPRNGEGSMIYEMGIPVVEHDGPFHLNVGQKVPLSMERDNVTPAFLRRLRAAALEATAARLSGDQAADPWVRDALPLTSSATVKTVIQARFGDKAVAFDPSSPESNKEALDKGYQVVHGRSLSSAEWGVVKAAEILKPAGQIFPVGVPTSPDGKPPIPEERWTDAMHALAEYTRDLGCFLLGFRPDVSFHSLFNGKAAWWGNRRVTFNIAVLGKAWIEQPSQRAVDELLFHEFSHNKVADHYTRDFSDECCRLGAMARNCRSMLKGAAA